MIAESHCFIQCVCCVCELPANAFANASPFLIFQQLKNYSFWGVLAWKKNTARCRSFVTVKKNEYRPWKSIL